REFRLTTGNFVQIATVVVSHQNSLALRTGGDRDGRIHAAIGIRRYVDRFGPARAAIGRSGHPDRMRVINEVIVIAGAGEYEARLCPEVCQLDIGIVRLMSTVVHNQYRGTANRAPNSHSRSTIAIDDEPYTE